MMNRWIRFLPIAVLAAVAARAGGRGLGRHLEGQGRASDDSAIVLTLERDGTGRLDDEPIAYTVRGDKLVVRESGGLNTYTFVLEKRTGRRCWARSGAGGVFMGPACISPSGLDPATTLRCRDVPCRIEARYGSRRASAVSDRSEACCR